MLRRRRNVHRHRSILLRQNPRLECNGLVLAWAHPVAESSSTRHHPQRTCRSAPVSTIERTFPSRDSLPGLGEKVDGDVDHGSDEAD